MIHNWKIYDLNRVKSNGLVTEVIYACESQQDTTATRKIGTLSLSGSIEESGFISFDSLTQEEVLGWVRNNIDEASIEVSNSSSIATQIRDASLPTEINGTPWE
tara:strand:- start:2016 stop:2327 length:312 start_codon:yes stop_codon:yes gene_type:complete